MAGGSQHRKKEQAIAALLTCGTLAEAAAAAKINVRTLNAWLLEPEFLREYRAARRQVVEAAVATLQRHAEHAVARLVRNLVCGKSSAENTAARLILEFAFRGVELLDLDTRLHDIEDRLGGQQP